MKRRRLAWLLAAFLGGPSLARGSGPPPADLVPPRLVNEVEVVYPEALRDLPEPPAGTVVVRLTIGVDGVPKDVTVEAGVHPQVDAAIVDAVGGLRYEPATVEGQPVEITTRLAVEVEPPAEPGPEEAPPPPPPMAGTPDPIAGPEGPVPVSARAPVPTGRLEGVVLQSGDRTPIPGAQVVVVPGGERSPAWTREATTSGEGRFAIEAVPAGPVRVVVLAPGYARQELEERVTADQALEVRYFTPPLVSDPYRTVVTTEGNRREEIGRRTLSAEEVQRLPGNQGDALRAIQALPGVSRPPFGAGLLVVRGSAPFDTAVLVGEHVITFLFHFGALSTALPSDLLAGLEFIPGNFDARYGNHLGGVVRVLTRPGRRDGFHGHAELDLLDAGFHLEGPIGRGSFIVAARRSVVDLALPLVLPEDAGLELTRAPRYYDYQGFFDHPWGPGTVTVRVLGADDQAVFVQPSENDDEIDVRDRTAAALSFHRVDLEYRARSGRTRFLITPSYRYETAEIVNRDLLGFDITRHNLSFRAELGHRLTRRVDLEVGTESIASWADLEGQAAATFDFGSPGDSSQSEAVRTASRTFKGFVALYTTATFGVGTRVRVLPGVRATWYDTPMDKLVVDPRLRAAFDVAGRTTLRAGVGLYSQEPAVTQQSPVFGNPELAAERGVHTSVEVEQRLPAEMLLSVTGFYKEFWDRVAPSTLQRRDASGVESEQEANTQRSWVGGAELLLKKDPGRVPLVGWLSYTLLWSRVRDRPAERYYDADFVQRHVLNAVLGVALPRHFRVGARFQLTSGAPYTPVVGAVFDASAGDYTAIEGARNGAFLPWFHQLSLRIEKRWIWKWASATAYMDLQNVYNRQPVEAYAYAYDYRARAPVGGLPIVPWIGARIDW